MNKYILSCVLLILALVGSSCIGDLDVKPINPNLDVNFNQDANFAKIYAGLALTGNKGPAGEADIDDTDEGASGLMRMMFNLNELPTDEAICAWTGDVDVFPLNSAQFTSSNGVVLNMFSRLYIQIAQCNNFLIQIDGKDDEKTSLQRNEVRFIRALDYYYLVDLFGNVPFVDENTGIGAYVPDRITRPDLFSYIEKELKEIESALKAPRSNEYGRADQAAAWMLLSRLYLNAEVYSGTARWADAATYAKKVMDAGYSLTPKYEDMFKADNNTSSEMIMPICYDGVYTRSWSGLFFIASFITGDMNTEATFGTTEAWGGNRARSALIKKFAANGNISSVKDDRALFWSDGRSLEIEKPSEFKEGYSTTKFKNITKSGAIGSDPNKQFPDMDFPLFRLAEANLTFAEATLRAGGSRADAIKAVNDLRIRANAATISDTELTLDFLLDEKAREFYFEAQRRVDLIRYNKFTSGYTWDWKGGVPEGVSVSSHLSLLPIPVSQMTANSKLVQNPGY
ncbi:membrane protein [Bacteroidia bacterium]|nr:membrane protein [Bacteroidia bacterium]GHU58909.1 membrane protein [Bacteroidia bacterium]GHV04332.1 membrane protein [Bacteroidia bacterium]